MQKNSNQQSIKKLKDRYLKYKNATNFSEELEGLGRWKLQKERPYQKNSNR